tara:strand:- start:933 stop:1061 length:129 start_codon:yes stop_codon:yes gene_type:complete
MYNINRQYRSDEMAEKISWIALGFIIAYMYVNIVLFILNGGV